jgi:hypothetical protein
MTPGVQIEGQIMPATAAYRSITEITQRPVGPPDFQELISRIQRHDPSAAVQLSETMCGAVRLMLRRSGLENPESRVDEILFSAIDAIREGLVNSATGLLQFVRLAVQKGKPLVPTLSNETIQYHQQVTKALSRLPERHRDIVRRFYLLDQSPEFICGEMGITLNQFEAGKTSAKSALLNFRRSSRSAIRL